MSEQPFAHLHCHTHYSLLDGFNRIPELLDQVKSLGMNSCAITDHGNLYGALEFYKNAKKRDLNPVLGYEAYVAAGSRHDRSQARSKDTMFHITLLAQNRTGFQNLVKMSSAAYLEGFYYKPRIDRELLEEHSEGIICLSGCASSELSRHLLSDRAKEAEELVAWYDRVFGDRFYMEIQDGGVEIQTLTSDATIDLAKKMGMPLVATNDAHYLCDGDADVHDVMLCMNTRAVRSDENRMRIDTDQLFIRSPEQMYDAFPGQADAVKCSQEIADRVDIELDLTTRHFPVFQLPDGEENDVTYLRKVCEEGLRWRYGDNPEPKYQERLDYELSVIERMGYSSYFLIVDDFVKYARGLGIPSTARGSACGALVSYVLNFSDVCPIEYDLLFERFLDPSRSEAPDIDIDFCRDRREVVINYMKDKYGHDNVAQIGTFGTLKAKNAFRDVCRALGIPIPRTNEVAKMIPDQLGIKLKDAIKQSAELQEQYEKDPQIREVLDYAQKVEGLCKAVGTHACGVVLADKPLNEYLPLQKITGKEDVITQWTDVETVGILKMDCLGLRNLSILDKAVRIVRGRHGQDALPEPRDFDLTDQETYALLQRGETKGIFQFESGGIRDLLTKMRPDQITDIIAASALYRPGPLEGGMVMQYVDCKHGRREVEKIHPIVDEVLVETYGVMVYQEQVMRILNRLGGIELPDSYKCIKAIGKKKLEIIDGYRQKFIDGAQTHDMLAEQAKGIFDLIEKFAGYGFNKSHSTAYGLVSFQTAFLKAHFPAEFVAALLSCEMESTERIYEHCDDARRMDITIVPADINVSEVEFKVLDEHRVSFGLGAIKGVGDAVMKAVVGERIENGPYKSIYDLTERVDPKSLPKSALEAMVKGGMFDSLDPNRARHMLAVDGAVQSAQAAHRDKASGQMGLFGGGDDAAEEEAHAELPQAEEWPHSQTLQFEKEVYGFYMTSHPLAEFADVLETLVPTTIKSLRDLDDGTTCTIGGMVSSLKPAQTKNPSRNGNSKYMNFDLEDATGVVRCIMWPDDFANDGELVKSDEVRIIKGRVDLRGREPNIICNKMMTVEQAEKEYTKQVLVKLRRGYHSDADMSRVRDIIQSHPGKTPVSLILDTRDERTNEPLRCVIALPPTMTVSCNPDFRAAIIDAVGSGSVKYDMNAPTMGA